MTLALKHLRVEAEPMIEWEHQICPATASAPHDPRVEFAYHQLWHEIFGETIIGGAPRPLMPFMTTLPGLISPPET
ncbi:hypothetical protein [Mycobacterium sp. E796]|uniref:hypothetical protein n=1 Tax=Mycobacterium sp. E796 TaxID=1834151 RepID=UPI0012EAF2AB|nr:hypothetical protein [Mycobacterium sp. E796]